MADVVKSMVFKSTFSSWEDLCVEAGEFATRVGRQNLISISHSADSGQGVIIVWYWAKNS